MLASSSTSGVVGARRSARIVCDGARVARCRVDVDVLDVLDGDDTIGNAVDIVSFIVYLLAPGLQHDSSKARHFFQL
jgi:hypothetical protein